MAKLLLLTALIVLASAESTSKLIFNAPNGDCAITAGDVYIPFNYDKTRKFISSVHAFDVIESMGDIKATFDVTSTFMPCNTFTCYNTIAQKDEQTHLCLQMVLGVEGKSDSVEISYPVSEELLISNMTNTKFDKDAEIATLEFTINLLGDDNLNQLYKKLKDALSKAVDGNASGMLYKLDKVINCIGGDGKSPLTLRMLFACGNPQSYSDNNKLVFKYDESRMFPENYNTAEDGISLDNAGVCFGYTKYYTLGTCSNPNSPEVKGNQVNVKENGLSAGGVVGIVVACVVVVAVVAAVAIFFVIKKTA